MGLWWVARSFIRPPASHRTLLQSYIWAWSRYRFQASLLEKLDFKLFGQSLPFFKHLYLYSFLFSRQLLESQSFLYVNLFESKWKVPFMLSISLNGLFHVNSWEEVFIKLIPHGLFSAQDRIGVNYECDRRYKMQAFLSSHFCTKMQKVAYCLHVQWLCECVITPPNAWDVWMKFAHLLWQWIVIEKLLLKKKNKVKATEY